MATPTRQHRKRRRNQVHQRKECGILHLQVVGCSRRLSSSTCLFLLLLRTKHENRSTTYREAQSGASFRQKERGVRLRERQLRTRGYCQDFDLNLGGLERSNVGSLITIIRTSSAARRGSGHQEARGNGEGSGLGGRIRVLQPRGLSCALLNQRSETKQE
ncbi:hypothetical protein B0H13DRAFT_1853760 [Mycena leptocephala]|nr:hypothetical protein B0H13DRAFT_1853760 [Mycena leptocephala]